MNIIKLDAIDSTNNYLKSLLNDKCIDDYTIVTAKFQKKGKGQMGGVWESEVSKNLMCSVYLSNSIIKLTDQFIINILVCLAIKKSLNKFNVPQLSVKWPNDIMSGKNKICGVLIENIIKMNSIQDIIIGIGLNVNQTEFKNLPNAISLKMINGKHYNIDEILFEIINDIKFYYKLLENGKQLQLYNQYKNSLYRINKPSMFRLANKELILGYIKGVNEYGMLIIQMEDDVEKTFGLKQISLVN